MGKTAEYAANLAEMESCRNRIRELENKVSDLRMSRRVLMNLLEHAQNSRQSELDRLYKENSRLQRQLSSYARQLWIQNGRLAKAAGEKSDEEQAKTGGEGFCSVDSGIQPVSRP